MALQVWLPLNKSVNRNCGLNNGISTTNTAVFSSTGSPVNGCYTFTTGQSITLSGVDFSKLKTCSISLWVYQNAKKWLETFGLASRLNHRPRELSGGEQQRVAIARSLINNPDIILADEPTGNLDVKAAQGIIDILQHVRSGKAKTLIMVTHDLTLAKQANRVIELKKQ